MSRNQGGWIIVLLVAIIGLVSYATFLANPNPEGLTRWEYRIEGPDDISLMTTINTLGNDGWELAFARRATTDPDGAIYEMIFKRPRQADSAIRRIIDAITGQERRDRLTALEEYQEWRDELLGGNSSP